jgi:hypothetical protein
MAAAEVTTLVIEKGTYFEATFNLFDPDQSSSVLTGLTTTYARIRKHAASTSYQEFSKTITSGTGTIRLSLTAEQTASLSAGRNYFDVILTLGGNKVKVLKGMAIVEESASV